MLSAMWRENRTDLSILDELELAMEVMGRVAKQQTKFFGHVVWCGAVLVRW